MKTREIVREAIGALMRKVLQEAFIYVSLSAILLCIASYDAEASSQPNLCFQSGHKSWMPLDPNGFNDLKRRCDEGDDDAWKKGWHLHPDNSAPAPSRGSRTQSQSSQSTSQSQSSQSTSQSQSSQSTSQSQSSQSTSRSQSSQSTSQSQSSQSTSQSQSSQSTSRSRSRFNDRHPGCPSVTNWPSGKVIYNCQSSDNGGERTFDLREGAPGAVVYEN